MSGFLAMLNPAGAPVDEELLARMTARMKYRGPDATSTLTCGRVGFGFTLSRTGEPGHDDSQPLLSSASGCVIAADARVDDRDRFRGALADKTGEPAASASDAELILRGYEAWGSGVTDRLLGDFAFALWDPRAGTLFCARDHIGVKPLYYAVLGSTVLVSNSSRCLRGHPEISDRPDEQAIGDYLIFGFNRHPDRSGFADIRRLPPASTLTVNVSAPTHAAVRRYWRLPVADVIRYRRESEYIERFNSLFSAAVADRVRGSAAVLMSGGLDSTSVAVTAKRVQSSHAGESHLEAFTLFYDTLIEDEEPEYAAIAADAIGLPLHRVRLDDDRAAELWLTADADTPEPMGTPMTGNLARFFTTSAAGIRVGLTGEGGDPATHLLPDDGFHYLRKHAIAAGLAAWSYRRRHGRLPRIGLRTAIRRRLRSSTTDGAVYPPWLNPALERSLGLRDRFDALNAPPSDPDAVRPAAHRDLASPEWSLLLEGYDPGYTKFPADVRHPWLDIRLVSFLLALPPIPWCVEKEIVRRAMRPALPAEIIDREKAPLPGYPTFDATRDGLREVLDVASRVPSLAEFVDVDRFLTIARKPERLRPYECEILTRPLGLALWLRRHQEV